MDLSVVWETLLNGVYAGTLAAVACLLYKEHRLLNLAAAGWCCCGTWAAAAVTRAAPFSPAGPVLLVSLLLVTFALPAFALYRRAKLFTQHGTLFLFLGLGCHIALSVAGGNGVSVSISTTLPHGLLTSLGLPQYERGGLLAACLAVTAGAELFVRSPAFARHALEYRRFSRRPGVSGVPSTWPPPAFLVAVLAVQLTVLLALGAFATPVNQGNFSLAPKHMATSALAAIAAFGQPWRAFVAAVSLALTETVVYWVHPDSTWAFALSLAMFVAITIVLTGPRINVALISANAWIRSFSTPQPNFLAQLVVMVVIPGLMWVFWERYRLSDSRLMVVVSTLVFSVLSYLSARCCGVATAAFPGFGACLVYVFVHAGAMSYAGSALAVAALLLLFTGYLFFVRLASHRVALVTDLALILAIHDLLSLPSISGADSTLPFPGVFGGVAQLGPSYAAAWVLFAAVLALAYLIHTSPRWRVAAHAVSDPLLAWQNGLRPAALLAALCLTCLVVAFLMQRLQCGYTGSVSAAIADPHVGIACLLIGYLMASDVPVRGFLIGLVFFVLPNDLLPLFGIGIGQYARLFILFPIFFAIVAGPQAWPGRGQ